MEKLDTLNYTNIQFRSRFNLVERKRRLQISRSPAASCRDPPLCDATQIARMSEKELE